jgi:hypothetical protein
MRLSDQLCQSVGGTATRDNDKPGTDYHCDDEINFAHTFLRRMAEGPTGSSTGALGFIVGAHTRDLICAHGLFGVILLMKRLRRRADPRAIVA